MPVTDQIRSASPGVREVDPVEAEWAAKAHAGDIEAFGRLVDRYGEQARRVARGILGDTHDGDDAAQDAFLSALRNLGRYDPNRPFGPWLMRIVSNAAVDRRRRNKVRATEALSPTAPARAGGPATETDRRAMLKALGSWTEEVAGETEDCSNTF